MKRKTQVIFKFYLRLMHVVSLFLVRVFSDLALSRNAFFLVKSIFKLFSGDILFIPYVLFQTKIYFNSTWNKWCFFDHWDKIRINLYCVFFGSDFSSWYLCMNCIDHVFYIIRVECREYIIEIFLAIILLFPSSGKHSIMILLFVILLYTFLTENSSKLRMFTLFIVASGAAIL